MTAVRPDLAGGLPGLLSQLGHDARAGDGPVVTVRVAAAGLEAAVRQLAAYPGARLADFFASGGNPAIEGDPVVLRLIWGLDSDRRYLVTESVIEGDRYPRAVRHRPCRVRRGMRDLRAVRHQAGWQQAA